jgi:hypothetical protein
MTKPVLPPGSRRATPFVDEIFRKAEAEGRVHSTSHPESFKRARLTKDQKTALAAYNFALAQEDRYLGSVFVSPVGQRDREAKTQAAYERCKRLGMGPEHGL